MNTATEQKEVTANTVETFTRMSDVAFSGMERLAALNLAAARESVQQGFAVSMSISRAKNGKNQDCEDQDEDQDEGQNHVSGAGAERLTAYLRGVQEIVMDSQSEFAELMGNQLLSFSKNGRIEFPGMQVLETIAQQTSDMTNATVRNVTEITKASVRNVAEMTKASVRNVAEAAEDGADDVDEATDDVAEEADEVAERTKKAVEKTSQGRKPQK